MQNTETLERMRLNEAAESGLVDVTYNEESSTQRSTHVSTEKFVVYAVEDRAAHRRVTFHDALISGTKTAFCCFASGCKTHKHILMHMQGIFASI